MSYDVFVSAPKMFTCHMCNTQHDISDYQAETEEFNYTYNLANFFHEYIDLRPYVEEWDITDKDLDNLRGINVLNGLKGWQVHKLIEEAMQRIIKDRGSLGGKVETYDFDKKYDASNGWRTVREALVFLKNISKECLMNPNFDVTVC